MQTNSGFPIKHICGCVNRYTFNSREDQETKVSRFAKLKCGDCWINENRAHKGVKGISHV